MNLKVIIAATAGVGLLTTSCGFTAEDLARANNNRGEGYIVKAIVPDALNLPDGAPVRIGGVSIGRVKDVEAKDYEAIVSLRIDNDTSLREGSTVRLRYTTALGEMYVQVEPSATGAELKDGAVLPKADAETAPSVEDALASASLLINGGSLGQIQTIVDEVNTALEGRVGTAHSLLRKLNTFLATALDSRREIDRILDALAASSTTLNEREATINAALQQIEPAAKTLTDNTDELVTFLKQADQLARTAKGIANATRPDLTLIVRELGPVLQEVLASKKAILGALGSLPSGAATLERVLPNTFLALYLKVQVTAAIQIPGGPTIPLPDLPNLPPIIPDLSFPNIPLPSLPGIPGLPTLPGGLFGRTTGVQ